MAKATVRKIVPTWYTAFPNVQSEGTSPVQVTLPNVNSPTMVSVVNIGLRQAEVKSANGVPIDGEPTAEVPGGEGTIFQYDADTKQWYEIS